MKSKNSDRRAHFKDLVSATNALQSAQYLSYEQFAAAFNLTTKTVQCWASDGHLPIKYLNDRSMWWYITTLLKALGEKSTWEQWSLQSTNYNKCNNAKQWDAIKNIMTSDEAEKRLNKKIMCETDLMQKMHEAISKGSDEAMCQLFSHLWKHLWKVVSYPKQIYMYDDADQLWKQVPIEGFNTFITQHFAPLRQE